MYTPQRYDIEHGDKYPDETGAWVRWEDVESIVNLHAGLVRATRELLATRHSHGEAAFNSAYDKVKALLETFATEE